MKDKIFESLRYKFRRIYYKYIRTLSKRKYWRTAEDIRNIDEITALPQRTAKIIKKIEIKESEKEEQKHPKITRKKS